MLGAEQAFTAAAAKKAELQAKETLEKERAAHFERVTSATASDARTEDPAPANESSAEKEPANDIFKGMKKPQLQGLAAQLEIETKGLNVEQLKAALIEKGYKGEPESAE
jgi:hypothetical protein